MVEQISPLTFSIFNYSTIPRCITSFSIVFTTLISLVSLKGFTFGSWLYYITLLYVALYTMRKKKSISITNSLMYSNQPFYSKPNDQLNDRLIDLHITLFYLLMIKVQLKLFNKPEQYFQKSLPYPANI